MFKQPPLLESEQHTPAETPAIAPVGPEADTSLPGLHPKLAGLRLSAQASTTLDEELEQVLNSLENLGSMAGNAAILQELKQNLKSHGDMAALLKRAKDALLQNQTHHQLHQQKPVEAVNPAPAPVSLGMPGPVTPPVEKTQPVIPAPTAAIPATTLDTALPVVENVVMMAPNKTDTASRPVLLRPAQKPETKAARVSPVIVPTIAKSEETLISGPTPNADRNDRADSLNQLPQPAAGAKPASVPCITAMKEPVSTQATPVIFDAAHAVPIAPVITPEAPPVISNAEQAITPPLPTIAKSEETLVAMVPPPMTVPAIAATVPMNAIPVVIEQQIVLLDLKHTEIDPAPIAEPKTMPAVAPLPMDFSDSAASIVQPVNVIAHYAPAPVAEAIIPEITLRTRGEPYGSMVEQGVMMTAPAGLVDVAIDVQADCLYQMLFPAAYGR